MSEDFAGLSLWQVAGLTLFAVMLASGQMLFKMAATTSQRLTDLAGVLSLVVNPWLWLALVLYGGATGLWIALLQRVPLSLAYPFVALGFVIVPVGAWLIHGEILGWRHAIGTGLVLAGLFVITRG